MVMPSEPADGYNDSLQQSAHAASNGEPTAACLADTKTTNHASNSSTSGASTRTSERCNDKPILLLVIGNPDAPELSGLDSKLPPGMQLLGIGQAMSDLQHLSEQDWASVEVLVKLGGGSSAAQAKWQASHAHLHRCNSSSVSLTLGLEVSR